MTEDQIKQFQSNNSLIVIGANHQSSTMMLRDRLYIREADLASFYKRLQDIGFNQIIILSTTNLTEFILIVPTKSTKKFSTEVIKLLSAYVGESRSKLEKQIYCLIDQEAERHVFALAAALDGLVIGDTKLKEQLNTAYQLAKNSGVTGDYLDNLITSAQETAKRILRETKIGLRPISIASAAVQVARDIHGDLETSTCLLIGAGEMGEMLALSMRSTGVSQLLVVHPSLARAETISQNLNCHAGEMKNLLQLLSHSDIVISSMNTRTFTLGVETLKPAIKIRRRKPIFIIDIGVPGDIDPSTKALEDIFLYTLDDLEQVIKNSRASRAQEADSAWAIIDEDIKKISGDKLKQDQMYLERENSIERIRIKALLEANGDAEKATLLLLDRLKETPDLIKNLNK
ncbi:MAG: glutamyl-tRNA reductase [Pseudomonadota bacterium]|nr:glutamyl-tRNA reductase [Pseudomonadota bacterium]